MCFINYLKNIDTITKHQNIDKYSTSTINKNDLYDNICKYCNKYYKHSKSLYKHQR